MGKINKYQEHTGISWNSKEKKRFLFPTIEDLHKNILNETKKAINKPNYKTEACYCIWNREIYVYDNNTDAAIDNLTLECERGYPTFKEIEMLANEAIKDGYTNITVVYSGTMDVAESLEAYNNDYYQPNVCSVEIDLYEYSK